MTIEQVIQLLSEEIKSGMKSEDALRFTQAALNLAHVGQVLKQTETIK